MRNVFFFPTAVEQVPVDPSVVISLKTEWDVLQPTRGFGAGSMLPLAGVLDNNKHVK